MKKIFTLLALAMLVPAASLFAQVSVDNVSKPQDEVVFENNMKEADVSVNIDSEAKRRAERLMIRKERNTVDFTANLHGSLTAFNEHWQAAHDNTVTILASVNFLHTYKKGRFTLTNNAVGKFGYNSMKIDPKAKSSTWFKNVDEVVLSTSPQWALVKNWSYGANVKFRTQFAPGYEARGSELLVSNVMAPGYLDASLGFTYILPSERFPLKVNLAPIAMSATYVIDQDVYKTANGTLQDKMYGVPYGQKQKYEGGLSVQLDFDKTWGKNGWLRYRTTAYSFYGWITGLSSKTISDIAPTLRWENTFDIKATKYISTQIYLQLYYNKAECDELQGQAMLSVGLTYTFNNK